MSAKKYILFAFLPCVWGFSTFQSAGLSTRTKQKNENYEAITTFNGKQPQHGLVSNPRSKDISLNAVFDDGSLALTSTAIFAAVFIVLGSQNENFLNDLVSTEETKLGKKVEEEKKEEEKAAVASDEVESSDGDSEEEAAETETSEEEKEEVAVVSTDEDKDVNDDTATSSTEVISQDVRKVMEDMIEESEKAPKIVKSRPAPVSATPNELGALKKQVASTLASEMAMKERLQKVTSEEKEVAMMEPGHQKVIPKPAVVAPPEEPTKKKSALPIRVVKKMLMPWKKFSKFE